MKKEFNYFKKITTIKYLNQIPQPKLIPKSELMVLGQEWANRLNQNIIEILFYWIFLKINLVTE